MKIYAPLAVAEFLDRLSILRIKAKNGLDVEPELTEYEQLRERSFADNVEVEGYISHLESINALLWDLEDNVRENGGSEVQSVNDRRSRVKRLINDHYRSDYEEVKSWAD